MEKDDRKRSPFFCFYSHAGIYLLRPKTERNSSFPHLNVKISPVARKTFPTESPKNFSSTE